MQMKFIVLASGNCRSTSERRKLEMHKTFFKFHTFTGRTNGGHILTEGEINSLYVLLSRTQAEPERTVKQEQEEISRNHVQTFICLSV